MASRRVASGYPFGFGLGVYIRLHLPHWYRWLPDGLKPALYCFSVDPHFAHLILHILFHFTFRVSLFITYFSIDSSLATLNKISFHRLLRRRLKGLRSIERHTRDQPDDKGDQEHDHDELYTYVYHSSLLFLVMRLMPIHVWYREAYQTLPLRRVKLLTPMGEIKKPASGWLDR